MAARSLFCARKLVLRLRVSLNARVRVEQAQISDEAVAFLRGQRLGSANLRRR